MKAHMGGLGPVKIECFHGFLYVGPQLVPGIALGEDTFGQALSAVPAVCLLDHLENNFVHNFESKRLRPVEQAANLSQFVRGFYAKENTIVIHL